MTKKKETEDQMRYRTKIAIFLVAVLLTLVGFNLMASRTVIEMVKIGNQPDYTISIHVVAEIQALPSSSTIG
jgi:heme/copper-type cytochrome/quinol oxidase subunit 4